MSQCSEMSRDGRASWHCPRPVKAEGLCAQHLAGKRRREKNNAERRAKDEALREERAGMELWVNRLAAHGISARVELAFANSSVWGKPTGRVLVDPAEVLSALSRRALEEYVK